MTTILNKIKINKILKERETFLLSLRLLGFRLTDANCDISKLPVTLKNDNYPNCRLSVYASNVILAYKSNAFPESWMSNSNHELKEYRLPRNAKDIKLFMDKQKRVKELKQNRKNRLGGMRWT